MSEFDLIRRYFTRPANHTLLGVGDDAALVQVCTGMELAISTDMLVSGTHFFPDVDPYLLGHKTLAVNLSDMAAMGAVPRWATLGIALPSVDEPWLKRFSEGFFALAEQHEVALIGGDTTRGPLTLSVTIMGEVEQGSALRRSGAQVEDDIWVSGMLGAAALGLAHLRGKVALSGEVRDQALAALQQPQPRVALGRSLRTLAHSAIDISDGLLADLGHILEASNCGAVLQQAKIPQLFSVACTAEQSLQNALAGGDDYELCFTAAAAQRGAIEAAAQAVGVRVSRIGRVCAEPGCEVIAADGSKLTRVSKGYDHFA